MENKNIIVAWISNESHAKNINGKIDVHTAVFEKPQNPPWTEFVDADSFRQELADHEKTLLDFIDVKQRLNETTELLEKSEETKEGLRQRLSVLELRAEIQNKLVSKIIEAHEQLRVIDGSGMDALHDAIEEYKNALESEEKV